MGLHEQRAIALRGDPGLWGALKGAALGFVTGGPVGAVTGGLAGLRSRGIAPSGPTGAAALPPPGASGIPRPGGGYYPLAAIPGVVPALQRALPGGATGMGIAPTATGAPQGYHLNRSSYFTSQGFVAKGSKWVRNRTRNVSNGKANMRALRRLTAWDKADRRRRATLKKIAR